MGFTRGFTLIELLTVVAIVGILSLVVGSNYIHALNKADHAACQQNLRTIHTALNAYRLDYNQFPPADGTADMVPRGDHTEFGCGPAANGYWSGVSMLLATGGYCSESSLYCPALKRRYDHHIDAFPACNDTEYANSDVPQWRFLRYAYNQAATDVTNQTGWLNGAEQNGDHDVWLVRCLHLDVGQFDPERDIDYPLQIQSEENPNVVWMGEYELTNQGEIRVRKVKEKRK